MYMRRIRPQLTVDMHSQGGQCTVSFGAGDCGDCEQSSASTNKPAPVKETTMSNVNMKTHDQLRAELIDRAVEDDDFRSRLLADPKAAIEDALGLTVPESMSISVHEDSATRAHLVLPPAARLNEADLEAVAGGHRETDIYGNEVPHSQQWPPHEG